jgi:hypothetical protein
MIVCWLVCLATTALSLAPLAANAQESGANNNSALFFQVTSGGNDNFFLRDNVTSAQVLLTSANNTATIPRRLVVALPAGNSGALTYFLPLNSDNITANDTSLSVTLVNGTLQSTAQEFNNTGVQADLAFSSNATLGVTIIGAVRAMRGMLVGNLRETDSYITWILPQIMSRVMV